MSIRRAAFAAVVAVSIAASAGAAKPKKSDLPAPVPVDLAQIDAALDAQRWVQAKGLIERAKLAEQNAPRLDLQLAEYWLATGRLAQARAGFEQLTGHPEFGARAYQGLGVAAFRLNDTDAALAALRRAVATDATLIRAWNALGAVADRKGDWALAEQAYAQALRLKPNAPEVLSNRGYSYLLQRRTADAIRDLSAAAGASPDQEATQNNLRLALALDGRYTEAFAGADSREIYRQLNNIGYAALMRGDHATAEAYFTRALEASDVFYRRAWQNLNYLESLKASAEAKR